jgi:ribosomal protein S27E
MTIRFNCPSCNELIAFADKHSGKRAHCATCGQQFIIPTEDKGKTKKIKSPKEEAEPLPGLLTVGGFLQKRKILQAWCS